MIILNIDTSINQGSFCIAKEGDILVFKNNLNRNEQAGWLHEAIHKAFAEVGMDLNELDAVAVSNGPGSYTGLKIGLATAKGLCYALSIPLICINTLQIMAGTVQKEAVDLIGPMIDAQRMEVFTALYQKDLKEYSKAHALVLTKESFKEVLTHRRILFTGNGCDKFKPLIADQPNSSFLTKNIDARDMTELSKTFFSEKKFSNVTLSEPFYIKNVYLSG